MELLIREGRLEDLEECFTLESKTFPEEEAASRESISIRLKRYQEGFIVGELDGEIVAHINGGCTNKDDITDEEFKALIGHEDDGKNLVIFSLAVDPEYHRRGIATEMMGTYVTIAKKMKKSKILLLCKENLIGMYEGMGYEKIGLSASTHGGAKWYEMEYRL